jgi:methylmalonyl-CoA mutase C-terminal domain/subunit
MNANKKIRRVLLANLGLDGHEMGALVVAQGLREAGFEVIYLGLNQMPMDIVAAAQQEDVDLIGVSSMCGIHLEALPEIKRLAREKIGQDIQIIAGGIIPEEDVSTLKKAGIAEVFRPGSSIEKIIEFIKNS